MLDVVTDELRAWLEGITAGSITGLQPIPGGGQRRSFFVEIDGGAKPEIVLQIATGGGPFDGTGIVNLNREGAMFRALKDSPAAAIAPQLVGVSPRANAIATLRASGTSDFDGLTDPSRRPGIVTSYLDALAGLHAVGSGVADGVGYTSVGEGQSAAHNWLGVWKRHFEAKVTRPMPLVRFAVQWLQDHAPHRDTPLTICHGDVGPGNFLFDGTAVTTLVDWELTHLGDFHDDLGMLAVRGFQLSAMGDLGAALQHYARVSGQRVDGRKVRYYRAVALILGLVTSLSQLDKAARTRKPLLAMPLYLHLVPLLSLWVAEALLDLAGEQPDPPDMPTEQDDMEELDVALAYSGIASTLSNPVLAGGHVTFDEVTAHLEARARFGWSVTQAELGDMAVLLGRRPGTITSGKRALDQALQVGNLDQKALLHWAWRSAKRQSRLWPAWAERYEWRLQPIADEYFP
jgi:hypothetical protein